MPFFDGNLIQRSHVPESRDEWEAVLDVVSPARHLLRDEVTVALEKYAYNRVGPVFFPFAHPAMRDHFLPHTGLWLDRPFADPRKATQIWTHTAFHEWFGWPLPVDTTYARYAHAAMAGEVLATMESEVRFFTRFPEATAGMYDPAYPSTAAAMAAVGAASVEDATRLAMHAQFNGGAFPAEVYRHPAFAGGVAVTLHRQAAWAEHDDAYLTRHWRHQRRAPFPTVFRTLWTPDRHATIFARHEDGVAGLLRWSSENEYDDGAHRDAVARSLARVTALMFPDTVAEVERALHLRHAADRVRDTYAGECSRKKEHPLPLWDCARDFARFRRGWESRLRERTAAWTSVHNDAASP